VNLEHSALLRMATTKDATVTRDVLAREGVSCEVCADLDELLADLERGAGAVMLTEEVLTRPVLATLAQALQAQPPWSDVPVLVLSRPGADSLAVAAAMDRFPNVTVLERPLRVAPLVSAVRSMLKARARQYEVRALLTGLQEADQRKTEFLATLAHELRNPLAPISNALALLARAADDPASTRHHALIRRQVDHMVRLIDDLMEVSRITRGKISLRLRRLEIDGLIDEAIDLSRPRIEAGEHVLAVERAGVPLRVHADPTRLTQVFSNLLNNAAKYTPPGGRIRISARRDSGADGAPGEAVVEVSDSGAGLAPDMLEAVFDMFVQVGDAARRGQGGLGIGLTLAKSLVELHDGRIDAASAGLGQGATFTVRLPLLPDEAADGAGTLPDGRVAPGSDESPLRQRRMLVVDDNRDAADSLSELLGTVGATISVAYSGEQALQVVAEQEVDVAILDIGMPGMDGCEVARRLRARPGGERLTLIALTGWGQEGDRRRAKAAGFDHHLLKPVTVGRLLKLLA
jgi:signal transduction histidine kinase